MKALVGTLNKEKALVEAFSGYCETSRSPVSSSICPHLVLQLLHGGLQLGHLLYQPVRRLVAAQLDVGPLVSVGQPRARYLQIFFEMRIKYFPSKEMTSPCAARPSPI